MKKLTTLLALILVQNSYALQLEGVNGVDILAIDGKTIKTEFFSSQANEIKAGEHQIVVRYSNKFHNQNSVESRPAIFNIDVQQDTKISAINVNSYTQAKRSISKGITWQISSEDKQYDIENSDTLAGEGFMPYSNITALVADYNQSNNIEVSGITAMASAEVINANAGLVERYQQASHAEKKAFRLWLLEQDMK
ncbi:MAG: DUF2057 family protein [Psychromonas sp.]